VLLKLSSDQITRYWRDIKSALEHSAPPLVAVDEAALNRILEQLLLDKMQAWVLYEQQGTVDEPRPVIYALALTLMWFEPGSGTKNLLIYSLYGYAHVKDELWQSGLARLQAYAHSQGCFSIVAFTEIPRVIEIVKKLGGNTQTTFIQLEV